MDSWQVALIDQTNGGAVPPGTLQQYADALQQQVDNDLAPAWDVRADISVLARRGRDPGGHVPPQHRRLPRRTSRCTCR